MSTTSKRYEVTGILIFKLRKQGVEMSTTTLTGFITDLDEKYPWVDPDGGESLAMIGTETEYSQTPEYLRSGPPPTEQRIIIWPENRDLSLSQVHAYRRYLANMAKKLCRRLLSQKYTQVDEIVSVVEANGVDTFSCRTEKDCEIDLDEDIDFQKIEVQNWASEPFTRTLDATREMKTAREAVKALQNFISIVTIDCGLGAAMIRNPDFGKVELIGLDIAKKILILRWEQPTDLPEKIELNKS